MAEVSYGAVIERAYKMVDELRAKRTVDDESVIALYGTLYEALRQEVHFVLSAIPTSENEKRIRLLIGRYVIGCKDKNRVVWLGAIKPIETKVSVQMCELYSSIWTCTTTLWHWRVFVVLSIFACIWRVIGRRKCGSRH